MKLYNSCMLSQSCTIKRLNKMTRHLSGFFADTLSFLGENTVHKHS